MTALKSDEKDDLPSDLAVLPRKLSYRVSRNYFSLFLFACRSRRCYFLPLLLEKLCICVVFEARTSTNNKCTFSVLMTNLFRICIREKENTFILTTLSYLQQVESKILTFQCQNSNLDSRSCRSFDKSHSTVDDRQLRLYGLLGSFKLH